MTQNIKKIRSFNFLLDRAMFNCSWSLPQMQLACAFRLLYLFKVSSTIHFFLFSVCECVNQLAFELLIKLCMAERECKCVSMHSIIQFNPIQSKVVHSSFLQFKCSRMFIINRTENIWFQFGCRHCLVLFVVHSI